MIGARSSPYLAPGEWQFAGTLRWINSSRHFAGTEEQVQRAEQKTFVINRQRILDLNTTYALSQQWNMSLSIPVLGYGSWSIPAPRSATSVGPRYTQESSGLGDIVLMARGWVLPCEKHTQHNIQAGFGIKFPTGNSNVRDNFPDTNGQNIRARAVDQSIQPGDGGWGFVFDLNGFRKLGNATLFASGVYLANPMDVNGTNSLVTEFNNGNLATDQEYRRYVSVQDQYLARMGVAMPVRGISGLTFSLAYRIEGVPPKDLLGGSNGFRRPGFAKFIEPGLYYSRGADTYTFNAPIAIHRNRMPDSTGRRGDATFADYFFLFGFTRRMGK